jgi:hypothetical protein
MDEELFAELEASLKEGMAILHGEALMSHAKSSPSSCPSPTHPDTETAASEGPRFPPHDTHRLLR